MSEVVCFTSFMMGFLFSHKPATSPVAGLVVSESSAAAARGFLHGSRGVSAGMRTGLPWLMRMDKARMRSAFINHLSQVLWLLRSAVFQHCRARQGCFSSPDTGGRRLFQRSTPPNPFYLLRFFTAFRRCFSTHSDSFSPSASAAA